MHKYTNFHDGGFDGYNYLEKLLETKREDLDGKLYCEECYKTININEQIVEKIKKEVTYKLNTYEKAILSFEKWYKESLNKLNQEYDILKDVNNKLSKIVSVKYMDEDLKNIIKNDRKVNVGYCKEVNYINNTEALYLSKIYLEKEQE